MDGGGCVGVGAIKLHLAYLSFQCIYYKVGRGMGSGGGGGEGVII